MPIPKRFKIAGHTIPVSLKHLPGTKDEHDFGEFDPVPCEIAVNNRGKVVQQEEAFWHEVIEAINFFYELNLPHPLIQLLGLAVHQVVTTCEYETENEGSREGIPRAEGGAEGSGDRGAEGRDQGVQNEDTETDASSDGGGGSGADWAFWTG